MSGYTTSSRTAGSIRQVSPNLARSVAAILQNPAGFLMERSQEQRTLHPRGTPSPTCSVERAVLIGVEPDHVPECPHVVSQHDALGLDHEVVGVCCNKTGVHI